MLSFLDLSVKILVFCLYWSQSSKSAPIPDSSYLLPCFFLLSFLLVFCFPCCYHGAVRLLLMAQHQNLHCFWQWCYAWVLPTSVPNKISSLRERYKTLSFYGLSLPLVRTPCHCSGAGVRDGSLLLSDRHSCSMSVTLDEVSNLWYSWCTFPGVELPPYEQAGTRVLGVQQSWSVTAEVEL